MDKKALESFMETLQQNAELQKAIKTEFAGEAEKGVPFEKVLELAQKKGYTVGVQETEGELEDADLAGVSGGAYDAFLKIEGIDGESFSLNFDRSLSTGGNLFLKIGKII